MSGISASTPIGISGVKRTRSATPGQKRQRERAEAEDQQEPRRLRVALGRGRPVGVALGPGEIDENRGDADEVERDVASRGQGAAPDQRRVQARGGAEIVQRRRVVRRPARPREARKSAAATAAEINGRGRAQISPCPHRSRERSQRAGREQQYRVIFGEHARPREGAERERGRPAGRNASTNACVVHGQSERKMVLASYL